MAFTEIDKPSDYFNTKLYTGNGSTQSINGIGFQPDWVWLKQRANDVSNRNHMLFDSVRGTQKALSSNTTDAEDTSTAYLTSYDSDGFTLGSSSVLNRNTTTYASWNWLASNTTASNTDGSITSTVSANTTSGFSIVSYTGNGVSGASIGHGLNSTPKIVITKNRSNAVDWFYFTTAIDGSWDYLVLNSTASKGDSGATAPDSSVFYATSGTGINTNGDNYIAYCFAEKKGFSKFGSYTGNGNADGTFVYTGFKPAWVMIKKSSASGNNWVIYDNKRDVDNVVHHRLHADVSNAEVNTSSSTVNNMDFLSNGIKIRNSGGAWNNSGDTYIYMCFAENPFVTSTSIPCTAR